MSKDRVLIARADRSRTVRTSMAVSLAALLAMAGAAPAVARDVTVEDVLAMEGVGAVSFAPGGRVIVERLRPYRTIGQEVRPFLDDHDRSELLLVEREGAARPWYAQAGDKPAWLGSLSPSGRKAAIFWLEAGKVRLGVLAEGAAAPVPLEVAPQLLPHTKAPVWISEEELMVVETAAGEAPMYALDESGSLRTHPALARGDAMGLVAPVSVLNSGKAGANLPPPGGALVALRVDGSGRRVLAEGRFVQASRSPDGRYAVAMREAAFLPPDPARPLQHVILQLRDIVLVDLARGTSRVLCEGCDPGPSVPDWSPDGKALLLFDYGRTPARGEGLYRLALDGAMQAVAPDLVIGGDWARRNMKVAAAEHAGDGILMIGRPRDEPEARDDWYWVRPGAAPVKLTGQFGRVHRNLVATLDDGAALLVADNGLWRIGGAGAPVRIYAGTGTLEALTESDGYGAPITVRAPQFVTLRETLPDGTRTLRFVETATGRVRGVALPRDVKVIESDAQSGRAAILTRDGSLSLVAADAAPRRLLQVNAHLRDLLRPEIRKLVRKDRAGKQVVDWLILPASRKPGPIPLVVDLYPGAVQNEAESGYELPKLNTAYGPHMLLAHGYGVLSISVPLKQGEAGEPLADTGREVGLALDSVLATGLVDAKRLVLYGHSFGGYGTAAALATERRFAAAVAMAGPMNLASSYGQFDVRSERDTGRSLILFGASLSESGQAAMGTPPWVDPERYVRNSPVFQAGRIETPLLLIHGDMDYIAIGQAEEMFTALYRQGKDATLLRYWGEGHYFSRPRTIRDLDKRVPEWLAARLSDKAM